MHNLFDDEKDDEIRDDWTTEKPVPDEPFILSQSYPQSTAETVRQTGLAWSAGIAFFGAIVFMLFLGWIADLLLGSSPWGIVGGIVLGAIIGFMQLFRISSQIFNKPSDVPKEHPILSPTESHSERRDRFDEP